MACAYPMDLHMFMPTGSKFMSYGTPLLPIDQAALVIAWHPAKYSTMSIVSWLYFGLFNKW
eukprot:6936139-Alexandrium_andersonii.AAC.1